MEPSESCREGTKPGEVKGAETGSKVSSGPRGTEYSGAEVDGAAGEDETFQSARIEGSSTDLTGLSPLSLPSPPTVDDLADALAPPFEPSSK